MAKIDSANTFKRLRNRYRLVIMNDDTYEEVTTFKLSRRTVYVGMSAVFVLLVGLTIAMVSFTPLRFLIPGYGKQSSLQELRTLKLRTDSMEMEMAQKQRYYEGIRKVLVGDTKTVLDTNLLQVPKIDTNLLNPD